MDSIAARLALAGLVLLLTAGCGSIINGSTQQIAIQSNPSGASIAVDGVRNAETPAMLSLSRKTGHALEIELDGYEDFQMHIERSTSGWVWGNIIFGGLIGLAVDASTGGMYKLTPEQITAELEESGADVKVLDDSIYLFVTLTPDRDWELVAWLDEEE